MRRVFVLFLLASALPAQSTAVLAALATGSYFPLDVGDRWVYRIDDRLATAQYQTWRVDRAVPYNGYTYSVIAVEVAGPPYYEAWFRADSSGRVYILTGAGEVLFLDPSGQPAPGAQLQVTGKGGAVASALGTFPDSLQYVNNLSPLVQEVGTLARGVGLVTSTAIMLTGSSGGVTQIRTLVEASLAGGIRFPAPVAAVQLGIEALTLDVSGKHVTNCAVPCYFVACYFAPGADPPGTYKPCAEVRVALAEWPVGASRSVRLQFLGPDGATAFDQTLTLDSAPDESVTFLQLPLYSAPNLALPAGTYQLQATTADGTAQAALAVRIQ